MATTWLQFIALVKEHLTVDANRRGTETFVTRVIKNAVIDLQRFIIPYRDGHTTTYAAIDLDEHGSAQLGQFPSGAKPKAIYFQTTKDGADPECLRNRMDWFPWKDRQVLICGAFRCQRGAYFYAVGPMAKNFIVYPKVSVDELTTILVVWEGLKLNFADVDIVPWPDEAAEAVAFYVKAQINLNIDRNIPLAQANQQLYTLKRLSLWRDANEPLVADQPDDEFADGGPLPPDVEQFGAEAIPFLRTITTIEGAAGVMTAFVNVPTSLLPIPFAVVIQTTDYFPFTSVTWTLKSATNAHDPANGVVRPADYSDPTNARVWFKGT